jgi:hypothetical protein
MVPGTRLIYRAGAPAEMTLDQLVLVQLALALETYWERTAAFTRFEGFAWA